MFVSYIKSETSDREMPTQLSLPKAAAMAYSPEMTAAFG